MLELLGANFQILDTAMDQQHLTQGVYVPTKLIIPCQ